MTKECEKLDKRYSRVTEIESSLAARKRVLRTFREFADSLHSAKDESERIKEEIRILEKERDDLLAGMLADFQMLDDPRLFQIMKLRYIDRMAWADIGSEVGYHEKHVLRLRKKALSMIAQKTLLDVT